MKEFLQANRRTIRIAAVVLAIAALGVAWRFADPLHAAASPALAPLLLACGLLLGFYRPHGLPALGLAAVCLPPAIHLFSPFVAAILAAAILTFLQIVFWLRPRWRRRRGRARSTAELSWAVVPAVLAVLAAGGVWLVCSAGGWGLYAAGAAAGLVYLTLFAVLNLALLSDLGADAPAPWRGLGSLLLDLIAWGIGVALADVLSHADVVPGVVLLVGVALLAALAARSQLLAFSRHREARRLREVHRAGHRIIFRQADFQSVARQIHAECRRAVPFSWFSFRLAGSDGTDESWWAGPDGVVRDGSPEVPPNPPTLPGVHRRVSWKRTERELAGGERSFGRLTLWSDPRNLDAGAFEWLDSLLPQMVAAIERAFLDREARLDPLTQLPDRRVLEAYLTESFGSCLEEGRSMAVIMCDLDRFKKINDRLGHAIGDQALTEVAGILENHRREGDICCRYGGEEFALVLDQADGQTALAVAERIRRAVEYTVFVPEGNKVPLRVSAGVASFPELYVENGAELLELADVALYEAKGRGRNQCLLNIGQGRFRNPDGDVIDPEEPAVPIEPPTLFA